MFSNKFRSYFKNSPLVLHCIPIFHRNKWILKVFLTLLPPLNKYIYCTYTLCFHNSGKVINEYAGLQENTFFYLNEYIKKFQILTVAISLFLKTYFPLVFVWTCEDCLFSIQVQKKCFHLKLNYKVYESRWILQ